ncbi:hypothetical protein LTR53_006599 [Teratosphaeriaceae sp. CCFEE 6253]|nr:hypothetical protein LTR53_006599 [Teratosphaeriaceae sp. CCFEE 6253]
MHHLNYLSELLRLPTLTSIRLIRLHPVLEDGTPSCALSVFDNTTGEVPPYDCLSYTWGPPFRDASNSNSDEPTAILCNDHRPATNRSHYLWVDALCINQSDTVERSSQVAQMHRIFREASSTMVWLGPNRGDIVSNLGFLHNFHQIDRPDGKYEAYKAAQVGHHRDPESYQKLGVPFVHEHEWQAVARLMSYNWFARVWTFQEAVISSRLRLILGDTELHLDELYDILQFLSSSRWASQFTSEGWEPHSLREPDLSVFYYRERYQEDGPLDARAVQACIGQLIRKHRNATDPRDYIYGILGCTDQSVRDRIVPDYMSSVRDVYVMAARALISLNGNLQLLGCAQSACDDESAKLRLPSWVPDFSWPPVPNSIHPLYKPESFTAAGDTSLTLYPSQDSDILAVDGVLLDVVMEDMHRFAAPGMDIDDSESRDALKYLYILRLLLRRSTVYPLTGQPMVEAFWRTLMANTALQEYPAPGTWSLHFRYWLQVRLAKLLASLSAEPASLEEVVLPWLAEVVALGLPNDELPHPEEVAWLRAKWSELYQSESPLPFSVLEDLDSRESSATLFASSRRVKADVRVLGITRQGYLCTSAVEMEAGDQVWILRGGGTPFLLRPGAEGRYRLIGEAYVHGAMDGEGLKGVDVKWQRVEIA